MPEDTSSAGASWANTPMSRRQLLRRSALLALAFPTAGSLLEACGGNSASSAKPAATGAGPTTSGGPATSTVPTTTKVNALTIASPDSPVKWPIASGNAPIADGLSPETNATLSLYNYADYIDPAALKSFEKKYNCKVQVSTFNDQDEALAKLRSGQVAFDVYFPSYDRIGRMVKGGLVRPLNHTYIPNITNVWPSFQNPWYDREWQYSVPYTIYTTGIGWRSDRVEDVSLRSNPYDVFWDPKYRGKLSVLDDYREVPTMVLLRNGITDINTGDPARLKLVSDQLAQMSQATKPKVTITDYTDLPAGNLDLVQAWSGDMILATSNLPKGTKNDILRYWFPPDGHGPLNNDLMMIMRSGKNPVLAHLFLNHMLDNDVSLGNFQAIGYQTPHNSLNPDKLVADGVVPANLKSAILKQEYFQQSYRTLELTPAVDAKWHAVWQQFKAGA
jgi:spermidine/putrescine transport system substrate-binding protein